ncbi:hypothetical protein [Streptomyces sp. NPDC049949]|uniref:hypothetical protein n=1 Tax=Streptomyces sp. NPDC049949 TaxID=3154627 RepID=UPI00341DFF17
MPHEPAIHHPSPIVWHPNPERTGSAVAPVPVGHPGVQLVTLADGTRTLAYANPAPTQIAPAAPAATAVPRWAKTTALLAPTLGGGIGAAGIGISYAAPGLIAMAHAFWALAALVAAGATAPLLLRSGRGQRAHTTTHITQHISAGGFFGRAGGTVNHR